MTSGYPSDATENAVQANITAAGYAFGGGDTGRACRSWAASRAGAWTCRARSTTNGTQVQLWDCNGGPTSAGRSRRASSCRSTATSAWTPPAGAHQRHPGDHLGLQRQTNQQWNVNSDGTITGVQSGLCLDASGFGTANGTKIQLWQCLNGANQKWTLRS